MTLISKSNSGSNRSVSGRRLSGRGESIRAFLYPVLLTIAQTVSTSVLCDDTTTAPTEAGRDSEPGARTASPDQLCQLLAVAAANNDLPVDFFTRLIWQESRFNPNIVSHAGAQGVAQFMPETAKLRGLANPFDTSEAIEQSAQLLRDLHRQFGNLGLAAAAYNAGPQRVRDWLGGRRPLPGETRTYVRLVTGRTAEQWRTTENEPIERPAANDVPCNQGATPGGQLNSVTATRKAESIKPWGVEVVGGPTPVKALARYREWKQKYAPIVPDLEPHVVIRGFLGEMGAARARIPADSREEAKRLCTALKAAGTYCDVMRN